MSKRERVLPSWKELKDDMKEMSFKEKVEHLWGYYALYALALLFVVGMITAFVVTTTINKNKEILLSGIIVNVSMDVKGYNYLSEDYFAHLGGQKGKQTVELTGTDFSSVLDPTSAEDNYTAATKLTNLASARMLDYAILDAFALDHYLQWEKDLFLDLRKVFSEEKLAELKEKDMVWYILWDANSQEYQDVDEIDPDDPRLIPIALKLDKTKFGQDNMHGQKAFFVVLALNKGTEASVALWEHIENWP